MNYFLIKVPVFIRGMLNFRKIYRIAIPRMDSVPKIIVRSTVAVVTLEFCRSTVLKQPSSAFDIRASLVYYYAIDGETSEPVWL